ncbi:hypothetical protein, partial [Sporisorium scitamineum]
MAELEIIDAEIVPQGSREPSVATSNDHQAAAAKSNTTSTFNSLYPVYTQAEREAALRLLAPSTHDVVLDALLVRSCSQGWSLSFELSPHQPIPVPLSPTELVIRNDAVGLNPVDWKSVSYNFGIPAFPWILGRDIAGTVVSPPAENEEGWK